MAPKTMELHVLSLELTEKLPKVLVMWAPNVVRDLVDQGIDEVVIWPEALQAISSQSEDNHLARILVVSKKVHAWSAFLRHAFLGFNWTHFCESTNFELSGLHDFNDAWVSHKPF